MADSGWKKVRHFEHGESGAMTERIRLAYSRISGLVLDQHGGGIQHQIGLIPLGSGALKCFDLNLFSDRNQLYGYFE